MNFNLFSNIVNNYKFLQEDFSGISFNLSGIFNIFLYLFFSVMIMAIIYIFGNKIRSLLFKEDYGGLTPFINIGLGYIFMTTGVAILGVFSFLFYYAILFYLLVMLFIGIYPSDVGHYLKEIIKFSGRIYMEYKSNKWISMAIFLFVLIAFLRLIPPETGEDAISHHTSLPSLYLKSHSIMPDPKLSSSIVFPVPQLGEMMYILTESLGIKEASRYVHFAFYVLFLILLYSADKNEAPRSKLRGIKAEFLRSQPHFAKASLGVPLAPSSSRQALRFSAKGNKKNSGGYRILLFATAPVVIQISSKANVDFQWLFLWLLSVILITSEKKSSGKVLLSALLFGGVLATKLWAIVFLPIFIIYIALAVKDKLYGMKINVIFLIFSLLIPSLWYFRSYILTGTPFYPVFSQVLPNPLGNGLSSYIGFNKLLFHYENILKFSPIIFLGIIFFIFNKGSNFKTIIHSKIFLFFVLLSIEFLFMSPYFYPRYLLGLYAIAVILVSLEIGKIIAKSAANKTIVSAVYAVMFFYYFSNTLLVLPYGLGWANTNRYLTRVLSRDNSSYYDFDNLFNRWISGKDTVAMYGIYGYYYANFNYIDINNFFDKDNKSFALLLRKKVTKLFINGGDILWFCKTLNLNDCSPGRVKLLAGYPKGIGKYNLYSISEP